MRRQTTLVPSHTIRQRLAWVFAASALTLTLGLGGCRSGASNGGAQTIQQTQSGASTSANSGAATGSATSSNSAALQQLQTVDNQNQSDTQQLNAAQTGASVNYTSQQSQTQP